MSKLLPAFRFSSFTLLSSLLAVASANAEPEPSSMNDRLNTLRELEQSIQLHPSHDPNSLPSSLEDYACLQKLVKGKAAIPDRAAIIQVNEWVIVPGSPEIQPSPLIPSPMVGKRLYLTNRHPNADHALTEEEVRNGTALGRYSILVDGTIPNIRPTWIPESVFQQLRQQFSGFNPEAAPVAFIHEAKQVGLSEAQLMADPRSNSATQSSKNRVITIGLLISITCFLLWRLMNKLKSKKEENLN